MDDTQQPSKIVQERDDLRVERRRLKKRLAEAEGLLAQACQEIKLLNGMQRANVQPILNNLDEYGDMFTRRIEAFLKGGEKE